VGREEKRGKDGAAEREGKVGRVPIGVSNAADNWSSGKGDVGLLGEIGRQWRKEKIDRRIERAAVLMLPIFSKRKLEEGTGIMEIMHLGLDIENQDIIVALY
jgi:hypothetical protein